MAGGTDFLKDESLKSSIKDGVFWSLMVSFGNSFIVPFALKLGASNPVMGLLSAIPQLASALSQPLALQLEYLFKNRKAFIVTVVFLQALTWLLIGFLSLWFFGGFALLPLILLMSLNSAFSSLPNPSWRIWMSELVPAANRGGFFGFREFINGIAAFVSLLIAGWLLSLFTGFYGVAIAFAIFFFIAFISRMFSGFYLSKMRDSESIYVNERFIDSLQYLKSDFGLFAVYHSLILFSVNVAGVFFAVYALNVLHISYFEYAIFISVAPLASLLSMRYWGKINDVFGYKASMLTAGVLVCLIPFFWSALAVWPLFLLVEALSGFAWAGFNLTSFNYLLQLIPERARKGSVAFVNMMDSLGVFFGAFIGGFLADFLIKLNLFNINGILMLFLISGVLRIIWTLLILPRVEVGKGSFASNPILAIAFARPARGFVVGLWDTWSTTFIKVAEFEKFAENELKKDVDLIKDKVWKK